MHMRVLTIIALITAASARLFAQPGPTASVAGVLTEKTSGEYITGATAILHPDSATISGKNIRGAVSNKFGFFSIANVTPGPYYLTIRALGYQTVTRPVVIGQEGNSLRIDIQLEIKDIRTDEVVVQGDREPSPTSSISAVDLRPDFIQQLPAIGGETDIFRALQLLPGVKAVSEISSGLYVRGGSPDQNLTLLDGVIVYNPSHLGGFLSTFNSDAVRDIRLIKGAFPAEYGGRISSVLDMTMREGTKEKISGTAGISLINSRLTVEGPINDDATFMLSGRRMYLDLMMLALEEDIREETPTYYFYDLNGKVNYRLSESDHIFLSGYFGRDVLNGPPDEDMEFNIDWGNSTANLRWMHIVSPQLFTNFSAIYTDYQFSTELIDKNSYGSRDANFKSISGIRDFMIRGEAQYYPSEDHIIKVGTELTEHRFRADASAKIEEFNKLEQTPTILTSFDAALYAQDEWNITPQLSANLGARLYYFQKGDYFRVEPRLSLAYSLNEAVSLKGAVSMGNQFLHLVTRNDIALPTDVWFPSTANIRPAEAMQGVLGVESYLFDRQFLVSVEGYYKKMDNLLEYKDTASFSLFVPLEQSFTSGSGDAYGVEVFINKRLGAFTGWVGYTLSWTKRLFPELNNGREFYPRYDRRHDVSVVLTYRLGDSWELGATWVFGTGQGYTMPSGRYELNPLINNNENRYYYGNDNLDYTERNGYRLPPFHKLDLNFTHSFSWFDLPWQFSINIYNAYNRRNVFAQFIDEVYDPETQESQMKLRRITLFPIIPTFGLSFKF